ncbi:MAG: hypothetical protein ACR2P5_09010 [Gammaproteobacteria bacterium]
MSFLRRQESRPAAQAALLPLAACVSALRKELDFCFRRNDMGGMAEFAAYDFAAKGGGTPPVCIPTPERRDEDIFPF